MRPGDLGRVERARRRLQTREPGQSHAATGARGRELLRDAQTVPGRPRSAAWGEELADHGRVEVEMDQRLLGREGRLSSRPWVERAAKQQPTASTTSAAWNTASVARLFGMTACHSGSSSAITPRPMTVVMTGAPSRRATASRSASAPALTTPPRPRSAGAGPRRADARPPRCPSRGTAGGGRRLAAGGLGVDLAVQEVVGNRDGDGPRASGAEQIEARRRSWTGCPAPW